MNEPIFTETAIRFRLPSGEIIESYFSPIERVSHLREELDKVSKQVITQHFKPGRPWYLYTSPPMQKLELKKFAHMTLEELSLVPRSYVNVGIE